MTDEELIEKLSAKANLAAETEDLNVLEEAFGMFKAAMDELKKERNENRLEQTKYKWRRDFSNISKSRTY